MHKQLIVTVAGCISAAFYKILSLFPLFMNSMKLVIALHLSFWSIHTKDESKRETAFAFNFGVN